MTVRIDEGLPGGASRALLLRGGQRLSVEAQAPAANTTLLLVVPSTGERLNVPDTLKAQTSACVRAPMVLMGDHGRALASVVASSLPWHDALTGHSTDAHLRRYGPSSYQDDRNAWRRSARTLLLDELAVWSLDERAVHGGVNLFSKVVPSGDARGTLTWVPDHSAAGDTVVLRAEQDVLAVLATCPHPLDPRPQWSPVAVRLTVTDGGPPALDDPSRLSRDEAARALRAAEEVSA